MLSFAIFLSRKKKLLLNNHLSIVFFFQNVFSFRDHERHRVIWDEVFMHQPMMAGEFHAVQKYAIDHGAHAWSSERRNQIYIKYNQVERIQKFIQKWRAKAAAARR